MPRGVLAGVGILLVAGVALLVWRGPGTAGRDPANLAVGDCFDVPSGVERIEDIRTRTCDGPHGGEVFHTYETTGSSASYPTDTAWEGLIYPVCDPLFETYTGTLVGDRLDIGYVYFVPTADRWSAGDRRVTCFITSLDGSQLSRSYRVGP